MCSSDQGHIYIKANPTNNLCDILCRIRGLVRTGGNPIIKFMPPSDHIHVLCLPKDQELRFTIGQWVQVIKGKYKSDLDYVNELLSWGGICLLMVPHLLRVWPLDRSPSKQGKRPCSTLLTPLTLFAPLAIVKTFRVAPKKRGNIYFFNSDKFKHGLLLKDFGASAVSSTSVFISTEVHSLFLQSQHPTILVSNHSEDFPNPVEWCFFTDELVHALYESSDRNLNAEVQQQYKGSLGNICNIESKHIKVELKSGELVTFE